MANAPAATAAVPTNAQELRTLLKQAQKGDVSTLPALRRILQDPGMVDLLGGDLARQAEQSLIKAVVGEDLAFREGLVRKLELLRAELAGPSPTPVERLLVERIAACWLQVQEADIRTAQAKGLSVAWSEFHQRRMNHANKRYLAALKTLAQVRKLAVPVLQVNIAKKQINVASSGVLE